jgi:hypothetical protein
MTHWACDYIGKPWVVASDGPEAYDCWGLVVEIHRRFYGRTLEIIPVEENNLKALIRTIDAHPERKRWDTIRKPKESDIALMRQSRHPIHVGIWLDVDGGGILHCIQGSGVVYQNLLSLGATGWKIENYYRYIGG